MPEDTARRTPENKRGPVAQQGGGCEVCWDLAFIRSRTLGGHQADHYRDLLSENKGNHPLPDHSPSSVEGGGTDG